MALKKQHFAEGEIAIFDEACIYKRGEYWQFRMWLPKENKYARKSLRTRSEATAIEKGKAAYLEIYANLQQGKSYFSITTKEGVEKYLSFRMRDVELGHIVKGRHTTILLTPARCEAKERALSVPFLMMFARVVLAFGFFKTARLMAKLNGFMLIRPIAARPLPAN